MRVLVTAQPTISHLRAVVPAAQALRRRGCEVLVGIAPFLRGEVSAYGFEAVPVGVPPRPAAGGPARWPVTGADADQGVMRQLFGEPVLQRARGLLEVSRDWRPDLVLRDHAELGGYLAADVLDIPHVAVVSTGRAEWSRDPAIAQALAAHRAALGLPPDPAGHRRGLSVNLMPAVYDPAAAGRPNSRSHRQTNPERAGEELPSWLAELPAGRPLVLASLGTIFHRVPGRLDGFVAALAEVECSAVVAVGRGVDTSRPASLPDHVRLVDEVPQPLLLECCDAFVTHGGFNSVRESLRLGVPMVITPVARDQPYNAARCAELGVAVALPAEAPGAEAVAAAVRQVLAEPGFRATARAVQRAIVALPSLDALAADLTEGRR